MNDTHPKIVAMQYELQRKRSPQERMHLALEYSAYIIHLSRTELEKRFSKIEAKIEWVRINYGEDLARGYRKALRERGDDV